MASIEQITEATIQAVFVRAHATCGIENDLILISVVVQMCMFK
jgi:hypothetical protein